MNDSIDFKTIAEEWLKTKKKSGNVKNTTLAAYALSMRKYLCPLFYDMDSINSESVQNFIDKNLQNGIGLKRIKDIIVVLKMILKYADAKGYKTYKGMLLNYPKDYKTSEIEVFTPKHLRILMDYLVSNINSKNLGILICLNTGMRIGEICGLKWSDLNMKRKLISVNKTIYRIYNGSHEFKKSEVIVSSPKTKNSFRTIPMTGFLFKYIKMMYPNGLKDNFILSSDVVPIEPRTYRYYFHKLLISLQLPDLKFHSLRHTFATRCVESQCDYKTLSAILGHSKISTTLNLYVHPSHDQKRHCIEKMLKSLKI